MVSLKASTSLGGDLHHAYAILLLVQQAAVPDHFGQRGTNRLEVVGVDDCRYCHDRHSWTADVRCVSSQVPGNGNTRVEPAVVRAVEDAEAKPLERSRVWQEPGDLQPAKARI